MHTYVHTFIATNNYILFIYVCIYIYNEASLNKHSELRTKCIEKTIILSSKILIPKDVSKTFLTCGRGKPLYCSKNHQKYLHTHYVNVHVRTYMFVCSFLLYLRTPLLMYVRTYLL